MLACVGVEIRVGSSVLSGPANVILPHRIFRLATYMDMSATEGDAPHRLIAAMARLWRSLEPSRCPSFTRSRTEQMHVGAIAERGDEIVTD